ncbi:mycothiol transferase [Streptomyces nitrosporeus]|uniref:DUF664 domain-containing protein n=1 Tax=Streptomyces nitrosporeus TaxID=28894 RepID=A0A5J6FHN5_9ACTN|nr:DinB family protein [Streptomyces nitrosporeus]QEU76109.1 DUF664 domain-containing protein [Streptomyces nitrosporeus]
MNSAGIFADAFGRIREAVHETVEGLPPGLLNARPDDGANSVAWLVWHLTRVQDDHVSDAAGTEQIWTSRGWSSRFALPLPEDSTGYGHTDAQAGSVRVESGDLLLGYHDAVHEQTLAFVHGLDGRALDRVVDESWSPPVTLGVRLISVVCDDLQHVGQAAFVRGVLSRR